MVKNLSAIQETWVRSLGQEDSLEKGMLPTPVFLPGKFMDREACQATLSGVTMSRTGLRGLTLSLLRLFPTPALQSPLIFCRSTGSSGLCIASGAVSP